MIVRLYDLGLLLLTLVLIYPQIDFFGNFPVKN